MAGSDASTLLSEIRRASQQLANGRRAEALLIYEEVCAGAGELAPVQFELGNLCLEFGDAFRAMSHYRTAVEQAPDNARYLALLGVACLNQGESEQAREALEAALAIDPSIPEAQHALGLYFRNRADYEQAAVHLERALELKPGDINTRKNLVSVLAELNRYDEALVHARKAARQDSSDPGAQFLLSEILAQVGEIDAAVRSLQQILRRHRNFGLAYDLLARIRRVANPEDPLIRQAEDALQKGMSPAERVSIHFALGKMYDDCGEYERAFANFTQGNTQRSKPYDVRNDERLLRALEKLFTPALLDELSAFGNPSAQPVFIVGMPRSGTTLMERIIANHPRAAGAGELPEIWRIAKLLMPNHGARGDLAHARRELTAATLAQHASDYLRALGQGRPDAERIVDKMPTNFFLLGLIRVLFPKAAILHAVRNPLDTCLSCYFQNFTSIRWSSDLELIGRVYGLYRQAMDYWGATLPAGAIVDIRYEDLVTEPEQQARRMLEACGLNWDPAVLEFHREKTVVRTASIGQARQAIYTSSQRRWMNYAGHIGELAGNLAPYLQDDREQLRSHGIELPAGRGWLRRLWR